MCNISLKLAGCRTHEGGLNGWSPSFHTTRLRPNKCLFVADMKFVRGMGCKKIT